MKNREASKSGSPGKTESQHGKDIAVVYNGNGEKSKNTTAPSNVSAESMNSMDKTFYCRLCLSQTQKMTQRSFLPPGTRVVHAGMPPEPQEVVKTVKSTL